MSKVANMLNMVKILEDGEIHNINELAKQLEVTPRMIRVYKSELEQAGIYINGVRGAYGGYELDKQHNTIDIGLTVEEIEVLNENLYKNSVGNDKYNAILYKIINTYKDNEKKKGINKLKNIQGDKNDLYSIYKDFRNAINEKNKVFIEFSSINTGITKRIIHPAEVFNYLEDWYTAAFCELRQEIRLFKLKNILKYKILDEKYSKKFEIKK